jgi:hypothetical protein
VQVLGSVAVVDVEQAKGAMDALADKYEPYRNDRPPGPLVRLRPDRALCWRANDG